MELTFEQMAQTERMPANTVADHENQPKKEANLPSAGLLFCKEEDQSHTKRRVHD